jgi:hypothetical protein
MSPVDDLVLIPLSANSMTLILHVTGAITMAKFHGCTCSTLVIDLCVSMDGYHV